MRLRVLYHGNCFDGAASAALFWRFFVECLSAGSVDVGFTAMDHRGQVPPIPPRDLDGDQNACVDFRYSRDPRLHWWFDHHVSAFACPEDHAHFNADRSGHKFYDPTARSCTKFLADTVAGRFGFDTAAHRELIEWAETIDGALFASPAEAVQLDKPALQLMTFIENNRDAALGDRCIRDLGMRPLADIAADPYVAGPVAAQVAKHQVNLARMRGALQVRDGVAVADLSDEPADGFNKFITYYLHPEARCAVLLLRTVSRMKISVGKNPWHPAPGSHNIAALCERYGGGGHPFVGGITVSSQEEGRRIIGELAAELARDTP